MVQVSAEPAIAPALLAAAAAATTAFMVKAPGTVPFRLAGLLPTRAPRRPGSIIAAAIARRLGRRLRQRRAERVWRAEVIDLCTGFAAELAAGRPAEEALSRAAYDLDPGVADGLAPVVSAARFGRDVATSLDQVARRPGAEGLRSLAACWRVGVDRGGALAPVVDGLVTMLRDEEACRAEVEAQLAGPRATAALLAVLPVLGLAAGAAMGARPLDFLFGTWPGAVCLLAAVALDALGLWWAARITRGAERSR
jgi:tight adherence protein B